MRNVTKDNITDVFKSYMADDMQPRTREIMSALVQHLHDFARETNLTHDEWRQGIAFLEGCAAIESEDRHEFVLASDILGLSSLVDMLHSSPEATSSSVLGPFHVSGAPPLPVGGDMKRDFGGPILLAEGIIRDTEGNPIRRRGDRHLANRAQRSLRQPRRRAGHFFLSWSDDGWAMTDATLSQR